MSRVLVFCSEETDGDSSMRSPCSLPILTYRVGECFYYLAIFLPGSKRAGCAPSDQPIDGCLRIARANLPLFVVSLEAPRGAPACSFLPLQFHRRFFWMDIREGEGVRNRTAHAPTNANLSPAPCHFLYSDGALASKRASSSSSLPRSLA